MFEIPVWAIGVGFIILTVGVAQVLVRRLLPADRLPGFGMLNAKAKQPRTLAFGREARL